MPAGGTALRKHARTASTLKDGSAIVTGIILAMSLPGTAPWYVGIIAAFVAIGIGKIIFGGLGMNLFNPAMVGRAFVMISFAGALAASGFEDLRSAVDAISQATPMNAYKMNGVVAPLAPFSGEPPTAVWARPVPWPACLGGIYLILRRTASWEIPAGLLAAVLVIGGMADLAGPADGWTVLHHLLGGSLLFGAFFIATDPVYQSPDTQGQVYFRPGYRHTDHGAAAFLRLSGRRDVRGATHECPDATDQPVDHTHPFWWIIMSMRNGIFGLRRAYRVYMWSYRKFQCLKAHSKQTQFLISYFVSSVRGFKKKSRFRMVQNWILKLEIT